jgi:large repetitive protein
VARRVSLSKRLLVAVCLAVAASFVLVPGAGAGNFDEGLMGCTGEAPATCPTGTQHQPYSLTFYLKPPDGGRGEDFACSTFHHTSGTFPPGLVIISDEGKISGTPTEAGTFQFYLEVKYDREASCPFKLASQSEFIIKINPGAPPPPPKPKLTIGPESTTPGTVGTAYSLQMTANLPDAKTWSISAGQLPPGLTLDAGTGLVSGMPTTAGTYTFTVQAVVDAQTSDTKTLTVDIRAPLAITAPASVFNGTRTARTEVGLAFTAGFEATGGLGPYQWTQSGALPTGIEFDVTAGSLTGEPEEDGTFRFTVTVRDAEARTRTYSGTIVVAERLAIVTRRLKRGKVGQLYRSKLVSTGGVTPTAWRVKRGPLPRGIRFDRKTGTFAGIPAKAGIWIITVDLVDALRVKTTTNVVVVIAPARKPAR